MLAEMLSVILKTHRFIEQEQACEEDLPEYECAPGGVLLSLLGMVSGPRCTELAVFHTRLRTGAFPPGTATLQALTPPQGLELTKVAFVLILCH